jgi:predicted glycogen debranching enzyme
VTSAREWLIADGRGGYAMGTGDGIRTRRYHGLLLVASPTSEQRFMLVNGVEAWLETDRGRVALTVQHYAPGVVHPRRAAHLKSFAAEPWPFFEYETGHETTGGRSSRSPTRIDSPTRIQFDLHGVHRHAATLLRWRANGKARLCVRPLLSGRDWHALHHENPGLNFVADRPAPGTWRFAPYKGVPPVIVYANAQFHAEPAWFRQFQYDEERARGQEFLEDLASPGVFTWELNGADSEAVLVLTTSAQWGGVPLGGDISSECAVLREREQSRIAVFPTRSARAADQYLVQRGPRRTIIAGYPWFTDWGRDTFIALRGLCLATNRVADAEAILLSWSEHLSRGMMPNLFPSGAGTPQHNSVDASLWFVVAVRDFLDAIPVDARHRTVVRLREAVDEILAWYSRGTRHGIHMDGDGLLAAGEPGVALTWMDAVVDGRPVTPRVGKPVEVQALWINALDFAFTWDERWQTTARRAREAFGARFWNGQRGCLYDVVDVDHVAGTVDHRLRPNQVFACGGLPVTMVEGARARSVTDALARELWTPMGLRTLAFGEPGYVGRADGPLRERDLGYHQGTVWPWLTFAFIDAVRRTSGPVAAKRYLVDLPRHLDDAGIGHLSEIADGDAPHTPRGCPFQAWSLGALLQASKAFGRS